MAASLPFYISKDDPRAKRENQAILYQFQSGVTLVIAAASVVKFEGAAARITLSGRSLNAQGTSTRQHSRFTTSNDDSTGDDATGDSAPSGTSGDWNLIPINSGSSSQ